MPQDYLQIALPKGRLGESAGKMLERAGFGCPDSPGSSRKLVFEDPGKGIRFFWVKPSDAAIYVERGAADLGVCGSDILTEQKPDVYELLDLRIGKCRMASAAKKGYRDSRDRVLRVATKYPATAAEYYRSAGRQIDLIRLNGSIELAPILGLSDVIVDIVETGTTLRENDLCIVDEIAKVSARLICNKASAKFKSEKITAIAQALERITEGML